MVAITVFSCTKDTSNATTVAQNNTLSTNLTTGQWKMSYVMKADSNLTQEFSSYKLTFNKNGRVIAANDLFAVNGIWALSASENSSVLAMNFDYIQHFELISIDWKVTSQSNDKIEMEKTQPDNNRKDYLTLTRL